MSNAVRNQQKLMDVRHYGADPTGVVDSSAAIQAAINAGDGVVWFPVGAYLVNTGLTVGSNTHLMGGPGAVLKAGT